MVIAGDPRWRSGIPPGDPTVMVAGGCGPITVGIGIRTILGAGRRFTMAAGLVRRAWDGFGRQTLIGVRHGSAGDTPGVIVAGRHSLLQRILWSVTASITITSQLA